MSRHSPYFTIFDCTQCGSFVEEGFLFPWKCSYLEFSFWWEDDFNSAQVKILLSKIDSNCHLSPIVYDLSFCQSSPKNWKTEKLLEIAVVGANFFRSFWKFRVSCWFGTGFYVSCHFGVRNGIHGNLVCKNHQKPTKHSRNSRKNEALPIGWRTNWLHEKKGLLNSPNFHPWKKTWLV